MCKISKQLWRGIFLMLSLVSIDVTNAQSYYLIGEISDNIEPKVENAEALKDYVLPKGTCKVFNIPAGKFDFYLCSDLSSPSTSSVGAEKAQEEIMFDAYGETNIYVETGSTNHWTIKDWEGGSVIMYYNGSGGLCLRSLSHSKTLNIIGSLNGWDLSSSDYILTETAPGSLVYSGKYTLSGQPEFRFYFPSSYGWGSEVSFITFDGSTLPLSFNRNGVATGSIAFDKYSGLGARVLGQGSDVEFVVDLNNMTVKLIGSSDYARRGLYLAGACEQEPIAENAEIYEAWSLYETSSGSNEYKGTFNIPAGKFDLCILPELTSECWNAKAFCPGEEDESIETDSYGNSQGGIKALTGNAGHWILPEWNGGEVTITANLNDSTIIFDIPSLVGDMFFLVGSMTGWYAPVADNIEVYKDWALPEVNNGNIYENVFEMPSGELTFRFYKELSGWDGGSSYGIQVEDNPISISLYNGVFNGTISKGKGCWNISDFPGGKMRIRIDMNLGNIELNTSDVNSIDDVILSNISCQSIGDGVEVRNANGESIEIYNISGGIVARVNATSDNVVIPLSSGLYIIKIARQAFKVVI
ncbi:MAG: T9SS type A sorting domain-containing protein [Muribaculaceae bacterium]|nr:T9SS type A sorting domain-containing protein [Muribaculaceae bacterium]